MNIRFTSLHFSLFFIVCGFLLPSVSHAQDLDGSSFSTARVVRIEQEQKDAFDTFMRTVQTVRLIITSGEEKGKKLVLENGIIDNRDDLRLSEGERVVLERIEKIDGTTDYLIKDKYRLRALFLLAGFFLLLTIIIGGRTGVSSFAGLAASIFFLTSLIVPAITRGADPLLMSLFGAFLIACTSLYLAHGFTKRTSVALLSTLITLVLSAVTAVAFVSIAKLFGTGSEEALFLQGGAFGVINLKGLLLGGIIIGALGVLDDITTAQTAAVHEISKANPRLTAQQLWKAGTSVGREHIASLINTLALAYVGSSLPLLLLFSTGDAYPLWVTLNSEFLAEEIVRTFVGSITLLLAVPISTWLAVVFLRGDRNEYGSAAHIH